MTDKEKAAGRAIKTIRPPILHDRRPSPNVAGTALLQSGGRSAVLHYDTSWRSQTRSPSMTTADWGFNIIPTILPDGDMGASGCVALTPLGVPSGRHQFLEETSGMIRADHSRSAAAPTVLMRVG